MGIFSLDNAFGRFMEKVGKWIALNFLCLVCSLPIVTIGPAASALYAVSLKMARAEEITVVKDFFDALKRNFRKSLVIHIIMLFVGAVLLLSLYYVRLLQTEFAFYGYFKWVMYGIAAVYTMVLTYVYPLQAAFENTVRNTLLNALLLSVTHLLGTVIMLVITVVPLVLCYFYTSILRYGLFFYFLCGFAVTAFLHSKIFVNIFAQYREA